jgi:integrase/recombinase XerD
MLIVDAIEEYLAAKKNPLSIDTYNWYSRFLGYFKAYAEQSRLSRVDEITPSVVQAFVSAAAPGSSTHTLHARAQIVKGFLSWCAVDPEMGVRKVVVDRIEMPGVIQSDVTIFTPDEIKRLLVHCSDTQHPHRNRAIIATLLDTGIRASECCYDSERPNVETGLRMENLMLGRGEGESYIRVMGKGRKSRTVGLGGEASQYMRRYINRERPRCSAESSGARPDGGHVFLSRIGEPLSVRMLQQMLSELGESAGVTNTHPHRMRHTYAVNQLLAGTSDLVLMRLMGHTTLEATKIYTRAMTNEQARLAAPSVLDNMQRRKK